MGKTKAFLSIIGGIGTITGTILLPVGCEYTLSFNKEEINLFFGRTIAEQNGKYVLGVGSSNYGETKKFEVDGVALSDLELNLINSLYVKVDYDEYVDNARELKKTNEKLYSLDLETKEEYNLNKKVVNAILDAYGLMVSGAVILSIFALIFIISIFLIIKENRDLKRAAYYRLRQKKMQEENEKQNKEEMNESEIEK